MYSYCLFKIFIQRHPLYIRVRVLLNSLIINSDGTGVDVQEVILPHRQVFFFFLVNLGLVSVMTSFSSLAVRLQENV